MNTFFSSTDSEQLEDGAKDAPYYCSLIVNKAGKYTAKVAYVVEQEISYSFVNKIFNHKFPGTSKRKALITIDCDIEHDNNPELSLIKALQEEYGIKIEALKDELKSKIDAIQEPTNSILKGNFEVRFEEVKKENENKKAKVSTMTYSSGYVSPGTGNTSQLTIWEKRELEQERKLRNDKINARKWDEDIEEQIYQSRLTPVAERPMDFNTASCYLLNVLYNNSKYETNFKVNYSSLIDRKCKQFLNLKPKALNDLKYDVECAVKNIYFQMFGYGIDVMKKASCLESCIEIIHSINDSFGKSKTGYLDWLEEILERELQDTILNYNPSYGISGTNN